MKVLMDAVYRAVKELYDRTKPWGVDFVKFTIDFDETGRIAEISYTPPVPREHEEILVERVRQACQPHGKDFKGQLANVGLWDSKTHAATRQFPVKCFVSR
jgi:hypothetical protein